MTYHTAFRWWQTGQIKGYQLPSGTIVVTEEEDLQPSSMSIGVRNAKQKPL